MSHSNINKSVFVNPGICSCAVDAFLEHLFVTYLSSVRKRNDITDLLVNACSHYMSSSSREDSSLLREFREPVWSYIIVVCCSLSARYCNVCNACFSQNIRLSQ